MLSGRRHVQSWSQSCSELEFGLSSSRSATGLRPASNLVDQDSVTEFGLDQLRTGLRPGSTRFDQVRAISTCLLLYFPRLISVEIARPCWNLVSDRFEAKFHYAIWSESGTCRRPRPHSSSLQVCDQIRTCLRPDSIMEFGFSAVTFTFTPSIHHYGLPV